MDILILESEEPADLPFYANAVASAFPDVAVRTAAGEQEALQVCARAEVIVSKAHCISAALIAASPRLKWVQALTTGTDHLAGLGLPPGCLVTSARGLHGPQMAELAFLYMIALTRDFRRMQRNQAASKWERWPQGLLMGKTAAIVGVGAIGEAIASRCKAFGMRVVGVSSHRDSAPFFDRIAPRSELESVAGEADFLIALTPYEPATHEMFDARIFAAMRPSSVFINIARGKVADEKALLAALQAGKIRGAGLDVFETEPLPADSPLWRAENVIVTPRIGGMSDSYARQAAPLLLENLALYRAGRPEAMRNRVDFDRRQGKSGAAL